jgi:hypothetical protein
MAKNLRTTLGSAVGVNVKQSRDGAENASQERLVRPIFISDVNAMPNRPPHQGRPSQMPRHVNFMFGANKQTFEGTCAYAPEGKTRPGRIGKGDRAIIGRLGGQDKGCCD